MALSQLYSWQFNDHARLYILQRVFITTGYGTEVDLVKQFPKVLKRKLSPKSVSVVEASGNFWAGFWQVILKS